MIDTIEIAKGLREAGIGEAAADAIAQSILKAHAEDPPVTRLHVDKRLAETDAKIEWLRAELYRVVGAQTLTLVVCILGGVYWIVSHVHTP